MSHRFATRRLLAAVALAPTLALVATAAPASATDSPAAAQLAYPGTVALPDNSLPEGIANGPGSTFYAGSRRDGSIYQADVRTGVGRVLVKGEQGGVAVGMKYDPHTGLLWVAGGTTGRVTAYDGYSGDLVVRYTAPAGKAPRFLNDLDIAKDGVFVTDSRNAQLIVVPAEDPDEGHDLAYGYDDSDGDYADDEDEDLQEEVELVELKGDFAQPATGNGANGIRVLPHGDLLIVGAGALFRVDPDTGVADKLEQVGGIPLTGGDGLELRGRTLYVVFGFGRDSVAVARLAADAKSFRVIREITDEDLERPTTAAYKAGALYVVNGKFTTQPTPTTYEVVRVRVS